MKQLIKTCMITVILTACSSEPTFAPVTDITMIEPLPKNGWHTVHAGETLYAIAWQYGLDYRNLAKQNDITSPYAIHPGQKISVVSLTSPKISSDDYQVTEAYVIGQTVQSGQIKKWLMPARGSVLQNHSNLQKGINILGRLGDPVYATATGKIVYCGNGLRGYGNLIIIKHNSLYLSAYAHNERIFVKEGETVKQGQKIAEMGNTGTDKIMLHFEIRKAGKSIDPIALLRS